MLIIFSPGRPRHLQSCWKKYKNHDNDGEATGIYSVYIHRVWGIFYSFFRKIWHNYELYENMIILLHGREKIASSCLICVWMIRLDRLQWAGLSSWGKHCWSVCRSVYGPLRCGYTGRDGWSWVGLARARARYRPASSRLGCRKNGYYGDCGRRQNKAWTIRKWLSWT